MPGSPEVVVSRGAGWVSVLVTLLLIVLAIALLLPAVQQAREAARRTQSRNNLKQLGLALYNYHDTFQQFPPGGIISADGTAFHGWTTSLRPYLSASPFYSLIDFDRPWDDPQNLGWFVRDGERCWTNPSLATDRSPEGWLQNHYSANEDIFHRNSSVNQEDFRQESGHVILLGDAQGDFATVGYPYDWRPLSLGIQVDRGGFGCAVRDVTMFLMGDGSVLTVRSPIPPAITAMLSPATKEPPAADLLKRPAVPPAITGKPYWRKEFIVLRDEHKAGAIFSRSPDGTILEIKFPRTRSLLVPDPPDWAGYVDREILPESVTRVIVTGVCAAADLAAIRRWSHVKDVEVRAKVIGSESSPPP
jgi:type II secretory pathway pseudopilin PulG